MTIDGAEVETPFSDAWWLRRLSKQMHERPGLNRAKIADDRRYEYTRNEWLDMLWARFTGNAPLGSLADKYVESTREFMRMTRTNFAALVVEALQDRTQFVGARSTLDNDADGDGTVRALLTNNGAFMGDAMTHAFAMGIGYVMVSPPQDGDTIATATAEDPRFIAASSDPVRPNVLRTALKLYRDDEADQDVAHLYVAGSKGQPDRLRVAVRDGAAAWTGIRFTPNQWRWDDSRSGNLPVQGLGIPIVPLVNRLGMGEFEPHLDLLDRITNDIADRLWAAKFQIFIQRGIMSDSLSDTDEQGQEIDLNGLFSADPAALWQLPSDAKIWESRQLDIAALLAPIRDDIKELSAVTRTPLHMFSPDAMTGSAEGASLARESLSFKAEDRIERFKPPAARIARLGLAYSGKPYTGELQTMWAPVERFSLQQRGAAAVQAKSSGVPDKTIWSDIWQFGPETLVRMEQERRAQALYQGTDDGTPV